MKQERAHFLEQEWPEIVERIEALGLEMAELVRAAGNSNNGKSS